MCRVPSSGNRGEAGRWLGDSSSTTHCHNERVDSTCWTLKGGAWNSMICIKSRGNTTWLTIGSVKELFFTLWSRVAMKTPWVNGVEAAEIAPTVLVLLHTLLGLLTRPVVKVTPHLNRWQYLSIVPQEFEQCHTNLVFASTDWSSSFTALSSICQPLQLQQLNFEDRERERNRTGPQRQWASIGSEKMGEEREKERNEPVNLLSPLSRRAVEINREASSFEKLEKMLKIVCVLVNCHPIISHGGRRKKEAVRLAVSHR